MKSWIGQGLVLWGLVAGKLLAATFVLPLEGNVIGKIQVARSQVGENLAEVGLRYDVGFEEMSQANALISPGLALPVGTPIIVPTQYVLPKGKHEGIIINLAEFRLYYFPPNDNVVITMPIGIGRKGWETPQGITRIVAKVRDPSWHPSSNLQRHAASKGVMLPKEFPGGAFNPLGRQVLRLGWATYLIHSSNNRNAIGKRVSAGCIRLLPEDMDELFSLVKINTKVFITNQPEILNKKLSLVKRAKSI